MELSLKQNNTMSHGVGIVSKLPQTQNMLIHISNLFTTYIPTTSSTIQRCVDMPNSLIWTGETVSTLKEFSNRAELVHQSISDLCFLEGTLLFNGFGEEATSRILLSFQSKDMSDCTTSAARSSRYTGRSFSYTPASIG